MWTVDDEEKFSTLVKTREMIGEVEPDSGKKVLTTVFNNSIRLALILSSNRGSS